MLPVPRIPDGLTIAPATGVRQRYRGTGAIMPDKGKVEGLVGYSRRNFLVPIPVFESFEALNAHLVACCHRRMAECLRGHKATIGERLERDLAAFQKPLPAPYDACEKLPTRVSSLSLVRYRCKSARGPDADRPLKCLIYMAQEGSRGRAYSHSYGC